MMTQPATKNVRIATIDDDQKRMLTIDKIVSIWHLSLILSKKNTNESDAHFILSNKSIPL